jgi:RND superfamily putative drug exporter
VLISLLAALTLLPALLSVVGTRITRFSIRRERRTAVQAASDPSRTAGAAWGLFVTRRRIPLLVCGLGILVTVAWPIHSLRLGLPSANTQPTSNTSYKAYKLISRGFGAGANGPLSVVVDLRKTRSPQVTQQIASQLAGEPDVAAAEISVVKNDTAVIQVTPKTGPDADQTKNLVNRIRHQSSTIRAQTGARVLVGGTTAANIDTSSKLGSALPGFLLIVIALAMILLTAAFRTTLVPIKSIIGFLLSAAAGLGAEVAVFQWGWADNLLHVTPSATSSYVPIILLAIIFGLSGDYEVFLVSRIKEAFSRSHDAQHAIRTGTGISVRVISSAALIMFSVFAAFLILPDVTIKAIGLGLAVAVLLDAFVVRLTLVPAVMSLIGTRFWNQPGWLAHRLPDLDIEGQRLTPAPDQPGRIPRPGTIEPEPSRT